MRTLRVQDGLLRSPPLRWALECLMNYRKKLTVIIIFFGSCFLAFRAGVYYTMSGMSNELLATQAMLSFNHLERYEEISTCLNLKLYEEAGEKIEHSIINERELLADLLTSINSDWLTEYIDQRSAESIESFKVYKSQRVREWREPSC
ncbi:MAG: hypothetical protein R3E64_09640 [Halioglobus sp.]